MILLLNQLAGIRGFQPRTFLCNRLLFPYRINRTMTIDDASTRSRLDDDNFRPTPVMTFKSQGPYQIFKPSRLSISRLKGKRTSITPTSVKDCYRGNLPFSSSAYPSSPQIKLQLPAPRTTTPTIPAVLFYILE